ncbi:MAG TPA: lipid A deacylase LpxR family protein [Rhizomicrobium sp.]|nr:lipid A deacylase LpxR family protein [Rhizomicrobium sp.]
MKFRAILAATAALWFAAPAHAADGTEKGTLSILFENDIFDNTDHDYTNGVLIGYTTAPQDTPDWAVRWARWLPFFAQTGDVRTRYALGQDIFTPNNLKNPNPPPGARPYAGFLYGAFGLVDDNENDLDQLQITLGMVGPASLAEDSQKFIHAIIHDTDPQGWSTQLRDEPGLIIQYERSMKLIPPQSVFGLFFDAEPHYGIAIGNIYDYVNVGGMARLGFNLPKDYGPLRIDPSLPGSGFYEPTGDIGAYIFAGVDGRAIGRNLFLDGNSFEPSRSVDKLNLVGDINVGAALTFRAFQLTFTQVFRSREYATQKQPDRFGAVNLSVRF